MEATSPQLLKEIYKTGQTSTHFDEKEPRGQIPLD